jgi:transient receptor potential cation channel subfamily M protein 3
MSLDFFDSGTDLSYFDRLYHFWRTPLVKFFYNQLFYLVFLLLFSYIMLCDLFPVHIPSPKTPSYIPEIVLITCVVAYTLDELRNFVYFDNHLFSTKLRAYFADFLNYVQFLAIVFFAAGISIRYVDNNGCYLAARILLALDLIFWFLKYLVCFTFMKSLGPKITMIGKMMQVS